MFRRCAALRAKDPFQVLELTRSATKAEVKAKYREMAKQYHPDSPTGDTKRMEEINRAYNLLLKEGAYERFHVKPGSLGSAAAAAATRARRPAPSRPYGGSMAAEEEDVDVEGQFTTNPAGPSGIFGERRHPRPFVDDSAASPLDDALFAKLVGLDADTERVTPDGKYMYQNRDTGEFVTLDKPLLKAKPTRYDSHRRDEASSATLGEQHRRQQASSRALWEELSRKTEEAARREGSKTFTDRIMSRLEDSGSLPTRNKYIVMCILAYLAYYFYGQWEGRQPKVAKDKQRISFYNSKSDERLIVKEEYMANAENFNTVTAAAAIVFLAAASKKSLDDPIVQPVMDEYIYSVPRALYRVSGAV